MRTAFFLMATALNFNTSALAEVYRVGPGENYSAVSECSALLKPGDVVEVTGDITDAFTLTSNGTFENPITLRGITSRSNGRIVRPKITIPTGAATTIVCRGDWNVIEGLDISGAVGADFNSGTAIVHASDNLTLRNCRIHNNRQGVFGDFYTSGSILIEFCEFDSNGGRSANGSNMHSVYLNSTAPTARAVIQHCFFHDATGGVFLKSRCTRNLLRYNWFESQFYMACQIVDTMNPTDEQKTALYPMHTDILANVFFAGSSPGVRWSLLSLGGESNNSPGTEGDFHIAHNLFIAVNRDIDPSVALLVHGNVDRVRAFNNVFLGFGIETFKVYDHLLTWNDRHSRQWVAQRGHAEPIVDGSDNWVSSRATGVPDTFKHTLRGLDPLFRDLANLDFRPRKGSPLISAALAPLPQGRVSDLTPLFEPTRSIPLDLKPTPRRRLSPPSIGPFEPEPRSKARRYPTGR